MRYREGRIPARMPGIMLCHTWHRQVVFPTHLNATPRWNSPWCCCAPLQNMAAVRELPGAVYGRTAERPRLVQDLGRVRCKWGWEDGQGGALLPHGGPL